MQCPRCGNKFFKPFQDGMCCAICGELILDPIAITITDFDFKSSAAPSHSPVRAEAIKNAVEANRALIRRMRTGKPKSWGYIAEQVGQVTGVVMDKRTVAKYFNI